MKSSLWPIIPVLCVALGAISPATAQLTPAGAQAWFQGDLSGYSNEAHANFGGAMASGDFNADGFTDLVIAAPGASVPGTGRGGSTAVSDAGLVHVWYGSPEGAAVTNVTTFSRESLILPVGSTDDLFGQALAVGNFNGDEYDDLAIGAPGYDLVSADNVGEVLVVYGSAGGLSPVGRQQLLQTNSNIENSETDDQFGRSLVSGDFDGNGHDDLAIGVPGEVDATATMVGGVTVFYGASVGLQLGGGDHWDWNNISALSSATILFGWSLSSGDYDGLQGDDLAISSLDGNAKVALLYGKLNTGLDVIAGNSVSNPLSNTNFGIALTTGNFDGDQRDDLVVGQPGTASGGAANVYPGQPTGISVLEFGVWDQDDTAQAVSESGDGYGSAVAAGDFDGNGFDDLAIGGPFEDLFPAGGGGLVLAEGGVLVFLGGASGLTSDGADFLSQDLALAPGEDDDRFGEVLVAGDFNGDGAEDLAVGTPFEDSSVIENAGAVYIFYGQSPIFADGFETGSTSAWSE